MPMKEHIGKFLKDELTKSMLTRQDLIVNTGIESTTMSKHFNGGRDISDNDLMKYAKALKFDFEDIKNIYNTAKIEVCKDGTFAKILKIGAGLGAGFLVFKGVEKIIDDNCKKIPK
jgi:plasmid maintenance system antidote protein VapI